MNAAKKSARSRLYLSAARKLASLAERITGRDWATDAAIVAEAKPLRLVCDILDAAYAGRTLRDIEESFDIELTPRLAAVAAEEVVLGAAQRQGGQAQRAAFIAANEAHAALCAAAARLTPEWLARHAA